MNSNWLELIPEHLHDAARTALRTAFESTAVTFVEPVLGGASGALTHRIEANGRLYVLRMETRRSALPKPLTQGVEFVLKALHKCGLGNGSNIWDKKRAVYEAGDKGRIVR
jgi:hypothetical protein